MTNTVKTASTRAPLFLSLLFLSFGFFVGCLTESTGVSPTSTLVVITETTGSAAPPVFTVEVGDFGPLQIDPNDQFFFDAVPVGPVPVALAVSPNCQVEGENPRTVEVEPGEVAQTTFTVACS
jgi:hypothetical protein